jgi:sugar phosphate isomerase/epimerase
MPRPVILCSGAWTDLPLEEFAQKISEWGYQGVELACWGDHFEVQRALSEQVYCQKKLEALGRYDLTLPVLSNQRVGQAVSDPIADRHQALVPDYVWGNGDAEGVQERAAAEMVATIQAAQKLGIGTVTGLTGSPLWAWLSGFPKVDGERIARGFEVFARQWQPILNACRDAGIRFALEVQAGQIAFDLYSAEMVLEALEGREEFGFTFDPSTLHWQGVDPVEFIRRFAERIYHVHVKDVALTLNGRTGLNCSYLPAGDSRRGWDYRSPGHGGIDWEGVIRALNDIGYNGPLAIDWCDSGMNRDAGAEDACKFVKRLDFDPAPPGDARR